MMLDKELEGISNKLKGTMKEQKSVALGAINALPDGPVKSECKTLLKLAEKGGDPKQIANRLKAILHGSTD